MECGFLLTYFVVWQCERMVDQYVPQVILELETLLGPDKLCFESGLCTAPVINALVDERKLCIVCQDLATDALTWKATTPVRKHSSPESPHCMCTAQRAQQTGKQTILSGFNYLFCLIIFI